MNARRPRLAVFKFSSCDGCQLSLLDCEDELLELAGRVEVAYFLEATSRAARGPYDVGLVEGSISTPADVERIRRVRRACRTLVAIGACATTGGIQALRNFGRLAVVAGAVYPEPGRLKVLETSTAVSDHVPVDLELHGCPIDRQVLLDALAALLQGRRPPEPAHSVCLECKAAGRSCLLAGRGVACLGPITRAGCGALCPGYGRGCFGCFGPVPGANAEGMAQALVSAGAAEPEARRLLRGITGWAPELREAGRG